MLLIDVMSVVFISTELGLKNYYRLIDCVREENGKYLISKRPSLSSTYRRFTLFNFILILYTYQNIFTKRNKT